MNYYNIETKEIKTRWDIKKLYPSISFPKDFEHYEDWYKLYTGEKPSPSETERVVNSTVELIDGKYTQTYKVESISEEELFQRAKNNRNRSIDKLTVEVDEMVFDANEKSQERIARTILAKKTGTVKWVLADNSVADVTIEQLSRVLELASDKMSEIWISIY